MMSCASLGLSPKSKSQFLLPVINASPRGLGKSWVGHDSKDRISSCMRLIYQIKPQRCQQVSAPHDRISNLDQFSPGFEATCGDNSVQVEVELSVLMESPPALCEHHPCLFPTNYRDDSHLIYQPFTVKASQLHDRTFRKHLLIVGK